MSAVCALIFFAAAIGVISPFLLREVLDVAILEDNVRLLTWLVAGMAIPIVSGVVMAQDTAANQVGQSVMHDLRTKVYRHLQRLSLAFFTCTRTGEVQSRIANDIGGIENVVTSTATSVLANVTTVIATVVAMILLDWRLAAFALALLPLFVWLTKRVGAQRKKVTAERQASLADVSSIVQESLSVSGILLGKTMGRTDARGAVRDRVIPARRARSAEPHDRPLDDGCDPDDVRRHARTRVLVRGLDDRERFRDDHDRNARRLHHAADEALFPDREPARSANRGAERWRSSIASSSTWITRSTSSCEGRRRSKRRVARFGSTRSGSATTTRPDAPGRFLRGAARHEDRACR